MHYHDRRRAISTLTMHFAYDDADYLHNMIFLDS